MVYPSNTTLLTSAPIAESWALGCQLSQPSPQRTFAPFLSPVPPAPAMHPDSAHRRVAH